MLERSERHFGIGLSYREPEDRVYRWPPVGAQEMATGGDALAEILGEEGGRDFIDLLVAAGVWVVLGLIIVAMQGCGGGGGDAGHDVTAIPVNCAASSPGPAGSSVCM